MLEVCFVAAVLSVNLNCCAWNYTPVENAQSSNNLNIRIVTLPHLYFYLFTLSIPPTWRRPTTMTSMTSLHLMYRTQYWYHTACYNCKTGQHISLSNDSCETAQKERRGL